MELFLVWCGLAVAVAVLAARYDRNPVGWFFLAMLISPLLAGLFLLIMGVDGRSCPYCAERVKRAAKVCPHCRGDIVAPELVIERKPSRWRSGSAWRG